MIFDQKTNKFRKINKIFFAETLKNVKEHENGCLRTLIFF